MRSMRKCYPSPPTCSHAPCLPACGSFSARPLAPPRPRGGARGAQEHMSLVDLISLDFENLGFRKLINCAWTAERGCGGALVLTVSKDPVHQADADTIGAALALVASASLSSPSTIYVHVDVYCEAPLTLCHESAWRGPRPGLASGPRAPHTARPLRW